VHMLPAVILPYFAMLLFIANFIYFFSHHFT
jgi:hypothetical protein